MQCLLLTVDLIENVFLYYLSLMKCLSLHHIISCTTCTCCTLWCNWRNVSHTRTHPPLVRSCVFLHNVFTFCVKLCNECTTLTFYNEFTGAFIFIRQFWRSSWKRNLAPVHIFPPWSSMSHNHHALLPQRTPQNESSLSSAVNSARTVCNVPRTDPST